jgi:hypothetical protein
MSFAGAFDLQVPNRTLGIYCREASNIQQSIEVMVQWGPYGKLPGGLVSTPLEEGSWFHPPTLELASVKLFNVVLLPLEGFPTNPIKGSLGIVRVGWVVVMS